MSRSLRARIAAHLSWANTEDREARTEPARRAFRDRFVKQVCPDEQDPSEDCLRRAKSLKRAFYLGMSKKSADCRRAGTCKGKK